MRLSVVMPTYNRPDALPRALDALSRQTLDPAQFELVLVEDRKNESPPDVGGRRLPVRVFRGLQPGASSARNVGWRAAQAPLVLFMGDDIIAGPNLLEEHLAWHEQHPEETTGVLGHVRWARGLERDAFMSWLDRGIQFDYATIDGVEAGPGHFYTANVSLKRSMLERAGGFDEDRFPFLYEDIDLGVRLAEHGFRLLYNEQAAAEHLHQPRLEDWRARMARIAQAERRWIERHPDQRPYFRDRFADALSRPPVRGRKGRLLMSVVPRSTPVVGESIWANGDLYFRQQLGKPFMDAWDSEE
jgi:GT2 family glycosyltransferase